ncbi:MAG: CPBP family intramembrane metalloprotease [Candidatus Melainabacteria bacterium]|nr:CPBP family intramembrane metalloprotease [Candidatus Melainabacteria bacterium]
MNELNQQNKIKEQREKLIWAALIPQSLLLLLSIIWINMSPEDNVLKYFHFNFKILSGGILTGLGLAVAGNLFYRFAKKIKFLHSTVELFEQILAPTFKNLNVADIFLLSITAGFCEEIFFRGLILPEFGIIIASIAFGVLHLPGMKYWIYALWATLSGALLGWLFILSSSLWLPITAHAINNVIGIFMLKKISKGKDSISKLH